LRAENLYALFTSLKTWAGFGIPKAIDFSN